jgi:hypothetical protein
MLSKLRCYVARQGKRNGASAPGIGGKFAQVERRAAVSLRQFKLSKRALLAFETVSQLSFRGEAREILFLYLAENARFLIRARNDKVGYFALRHNLRVRKNLWRVTAASESRK